MASIVLKTLSILLGLFFIFVGLMKITPRLSRDMHRDLRKSFVQYAKVFPLSQSMGFKISAKWFRRTVGTLEMLCGLTLAFVPGWAKQVANFVLLVMMIGAVYTHQAIGDRFERMAPPIVFTFMLTCRLVVYVQIRRKLLNEAKAAAIAAVEEKSPQETSDVVATSSTSQIVKEVKQD